MYVNVDCKENSSMHFSISNNVTFLWPALSRAPCPGVKSSRGEAGRPENG